jgi:ribonuclease-3
MKPASLAELEQRLAYTFRDKSLLDQAVTHPSFAEEKRTGRDYQRLEFLGDTIVGVAISRALYLQHPKSPEGDLSKLRSRLVSSKVLAEVARENGFGRFLRLGVGEERTDGRNKVRLLADMFEAICGAVLLDGGNDAAESLVMRLFGDRVHALMSAGVARDYKSALQEFTQARERGRPAYEVVEITGPAHEQTFEVRASATFRLRQGPVGLRRALNKQRPNSHSML